MASFDPYRKWLGIPAEEQPPHHYRLLGIGLFESDTDVIANAADRQMVHVRSFQSGKYAALSQKILNELATARVCLLDPQKRMAYDAALKLKFSTKPAATPPSAPPPSPGPPPGPPPAPVATAVAVPAPVVPVSRGPSPSRSYSGRRRRNNWQVPVIVAGVLAVIALGIALMLATGQGELDAPATPGLGHPRGQRTPERLPEIGRDRSPSRPERSRPPVAPTDRPPRVPGSRPTGIPPRSLWAGEIRLGEMAAMHGHSGPVASMAFSPDALFVLTGGDDKTVRLWDTAGSRELRQFRGSADKVLAVAFSPDGQTVFALTGQDSVPADGAVRFWDAGIGGDPTSVSVADGQQVHSLAVAPDGEHVAVGCHDGTIRLIDLRSGDEVRSFQGHSGAVNGVAFSPDGAAILSGGEDGGVLAFNRNTGTEVRRFPGHRGPVRAVAVAPDGGEAISAGDDRMVRLWDLRGDKPRAVLSGHEQAVTGVAYSLTGDRAVSAGRDGKLIVWHVGELREERRFDAPDGSLLAVAVSPDGSRAVTAGQDGAVRLWGLVQPPGAVAGDPQESTPDGSAPRAAVPEETDLHAWQQRIRDELHKAEFEVAKQPEEMAALAEKLIGFAREPQDDPAAAYAFLDLARQTAMEAGDAKLALRAVDDLAERYDVDGVAMKLEQLEAAAAKASDPAARSAIASLVLETVDAAAAQDRFAVAQQLIELARSTLGTAGDAALSRSVGMAGDASFDQALEAAVARLGEMREAFEATEDARAALHNNPKDPQAALAVGKYECFVKGNWPAGLPLLARGADTRLAELAGAELAKPEEPQKQLVLADNWWQVAEGESARAQEHIRRHAASWYRQLEPKLDEGAVRDQVRVRIMSAGVSGAPVAPKEPPPDIPDLATCRTDENRAALLQYYGGDEKAEAAVRGALRWLAEHQLPDGGWSFTHQGPRGRKPSSDPGTLENAPNAATALALLPFLGAGHSPRRGEFRRNVGTGINFLRSRMVPVGTDAASLYEPEAHTVPSHALATCALCEVVAVTADTQNLKAAQAAVNFVVNTQNLDGGWSYTPRLPDQQAEASDVLATAWSLTALKTAQWTGLKFPEAKMKVAESFLDSVRSPDGDGFVREPRDRRFDPAATAAGNFSRIILGWNPKRSELISFVVTASEHGPAMSGQFYQNLCTAQVLREFGGQPWTAFSTALRDHLLQTQADDGPDKGSWYVDSAAWNNRQGGRLFCTAMAALLLETYYRYPPLPQDTTQ
ncbi:MAG: prenyltransferase/squalene oxidase repeat-containing protein [Thermoguttaceae bacterium]|jgi:hypothetical protein|nr:prenyltransferase/squalene oxidase repeat-containing protein [Thermoguttaceae bacterium]